jgi:anti-sigma-K factor RskA
MNYRNRPLRQLLAAEYVLGTLSGAARRRFRRQLEIDRELYDEVHYWEARLAHYSRLPPVVPAAEIWERIERRIDDHEVRVISMLEHRARARQAEAPPPGLRLWRAWAVLATAASLVLAVMLGVQWWRTDRVPQATAQVLDEDGELYLGSLGQPEDPAKWMVTLTPQTRRVRVQSGGATIHVASMDFELWWLNEDGPVSLGILPRSGLAERRLPQNVLLSKDGQIAVSLEPAGGSSTGRPTGPMVMATPIFIAS